MRLRIANGEEREHAPHNHQEHAGSDQRPFQADIVVSAPQSSRSCRAFCQVLGAGTQRIHDGGNGAQQSDESGGCHRARADGPYISAVDLVRRHVSDQLGPGEDCGGGMAAKKLDGRHHHQPGKRASGYEHAGDSRPDDVADAEVF